MPRKTKSDAPLIDEMGATNPPACTADDILIESAKAAITKAGRSSPPMLQKALEISLAKAIEIYNILADSQWLDADGLPHKAANESNATTSTGSGQTAAGGGESLELAHGDIEESEQSGYTPPSSTRMELAIDSIDATDNARGSMDETFITELMASMKSAQLIQPIVCEVIADQVDRFNLIAGYQRLEAAKRLGWLTIKADVYKTLDPRRREEMHLAENLMRRDLSHMDIARRIAKAKAAGLNNHKIARLLHVSDDYVQKHDRLNRLAGPVVELLDSGKLPLKYAERLTFVADQDMQIALVGRAAHGEWDRHGGWSYTVGYGVDDRLAGTLLQPFDDFMSAISQAMSGIAGGAWPADCEFADRPPCETCEHNSINIDVDTFVGTKPEGSDKKGYCLNRPCYDIKLAEQEKLAAARKAQKEQETAERVAQAKADGLDACQDCGKVNEDKAPGWHSGKAIRCPKCKAKHERRTGGGVNSEYEALQAKAAEHKKAFPSNQAERFAVALFEYARSLLAALETHIEHNRPSAAASDLLVCAVAYGRCDVKGARISKKLTMADLLKKGLSFSDLASLAGNIFGQDLRAWNRPRVDINCGRDPIQCVPLINDTVWTIDTMELLARRWKMAGLLARPAEKDFSDDAIAKAADQRTAAKKQAKPSKAAKVAKVSKKAAKKGRK